MSKKKNIRITEEQLCNMILEAIQLQEYGETEKGQRKLGLLYARKYYDTPEGDEEPEEIYNFARMRNNGKTPSKAFYQGKNDMTEYVAAQQGLGKDMKDEIRWGRQELNPLQAYMRRLVRKIIMDRNTRRNK